MSLALEPLSSVFEAAPFVLLRLEAHSAGLPSREREDLFQRSWVTGSPGGFWLFWRPLGESATLFRETIFAFLEEEAAVTK